MVIIWDGEHSVDIRVPESFQDEDTRGLCGTYNDNSTDDFMDFSGTLQTDVELFADTYATDTCDNNQYTPPTCDYQCTELDRAAFSKCHGHVDKEFFKALCKKDVCAYDENEAEKRQAAVCAILDLYSRQCALNNISLDWRGPNLCGKYLLCSIILRNKPCV